MKTKTKIAEFSSAPDAKLRAHLAQQKRIMLCCTYPLARHLRDVLRVVALLNIDHALVIERVALEKQIELFIGTGMDGSPSDREHAHSLRFDQRFYSLTVPLAFVVLDEATTLERLDSKIGVEFLAQIGNALAVHERPAAPKPSKVYDVKIDPDNERSQLTEQQHREQRAIREEKTVPKRSSSKDDKKRAKLQGKSAKKASAING